MSPRTHRTLQLKCKLPLSQSSLLNQCPRKYVVWAWKTTYPSRKAWQLLEGARRKHDHSMSLVSTWLESSFPKSSHQAQQPSRLKRNWTWLTTTHRARKETISGWYKVVKGRNSCRTVATLLALRPSPIDWSKARHKVSLRKSSH